MRHSNRIENLTRRTQEITAAGTRHFYFNDQWRCVEERLGTSTDPERQYIWNPQDRWDIILRDCPRSQTCDDLRAGFAPNEPLIAAKQCDTNTDGTLDEHLWCLKDDLDCPRSRTRDDQRNGFAWNEPLIAAKLSVAIADHTGNIVERYAFSAFGMPTILSPEFQPRQGNHSDFDWNLSFHAEFSDKATGWMNYGYRFYVPELGRWLGRDPITKADHNNLYLFALNRSTGLLDNLGESPLDNLEVDDPVKFAEDNIPVVNLPKPFSVEGIDSHADLDAVRDWLVL